MDYEKLIERLKKPCWGESAHLVDKERMEAATVLSTLQSENKKLRAELKQKSKLIAQQAAELERRDTLLKEQEAEAALRREQDE